MADTNHITKEYLHKIFEYKDGILYWKNSGQKKYNGKIAGNNKKTGYNSIKLNHKMYLVHRLIYIMHYDFLPKFIDHINNNKLDNRIENLREATREQNNQNVKIRKDSSSNIKNVSLCKKNNKFLVRVSINKQRHHIGYFDDVELAELVAIMAREKYHGNFANHG